MNTTLSTLCQWLQCPQPSGVEAVSVTGVAFDSRQARPGDLFVAIRGEKTDGHLYLAEAARRGAVAALVERPVDHPLPQLVVDDTVRALQRIAGQLRREARFAVAAVTGSVGKTTTKSILASLLRQRYVVAETQQSRNSQVGLPSELCNLSQPVQWFVAEAGMSHAGELTRLGAVLHPQALLYTRIAPVHLEFFPSLAAIAEAKAELIPFLDEKGVLVVNADDPLQDSFPNRFSGTVLRYGKPGASHCWVEELTPRGLLGSHFNLVAPGVRTPVELPLAGSHQVENFMAAACLATYLGVSWSEVQEAASRLRPQPHRGEVHRLPNGVILVDDSYNASPVAVARMLELLGQTPGRHVAVLGEMLELGADSAQFHRQT
ncbi:MAG: UDP-N-acetylmuramoyl-tripeptide--D-alanyl-D-alanine ligase, partial [Thermoanaerobaculum sp.]|nr:UDP-N-acetylmuramoyl-tripeptide--D-alanyl-D-alanine ligase [Thermoanaerobaculum sp.]MDW7968245.1 UDP-N-acetylmuramoyl-tripeptide--D-alanyl-D-alanine ligase [Thermoanaerobaculum sp.]